MNVEKIPLSLRSVNQWCVWRSVKRGDDITKVPFQPNGNHAKSNDSNTWSSFEEAVQVVSSFDGLGFFFSSDDGFCGVDLDGCRDPQTGKIAEWARGIIQTLDSYCEVSPSMTGVKVFLQAKPPLDRGRKQRLEVERCSDKDPAIEVYGSGRYFTVTGLRVAGFEDVGDRQVQLDEVCKKWFSVPKPPPVVAKFDSVDDVLTRARKYLAKLPPAVSGQGGHDAAYRAACVLVCGFDLTVDQAYPVFCEWNTTCEPPWSEREIQHKLTDASHEQGERGYLRNKSDFQLKNFRLPYYKPPCPLPEIKTLESSVSKYIENVEQGKDSLWQFRIGDLDHAIGGGVEPGELIVVGARPSHGKSLVALQCVDAITQAQIPSLIISEEMSSIAIGKRVLSFASDVPQENWRASLPEIKRHAIEHFEAREKCYVVEGCGTPERAAEVIRQAVRDHGVKFVVIDYVQLLQSTGKSQYERVTSASVTLKQVGIETGVTMLVLAQLNREVEKRDKFIPRMGDLKDSGQLEQDADVLLFLCWPHRLDSSRDAKEYLLFVAKNRNRPINQSTVRCRIEPSRQMLLDEHERFSYEEYSGYEPGFNDWNNFDD